MQNKSRKKKGNLTFFGLIFLYFYIYIFNIYYLYIINILFEFLFFVYIIYNTIQKSMDIDPIHLINICSTILQPSVDFASFSSVLI